MAMEQLVFAGYHVPWSDHRGYELDPLVASLMSLTATQAGGGISNTSTPCCSM
jgi:hypothetical protein